MSQQEQTQHTKVNRQPRGNRQGGVSYSMVSAKASNIPLPTEEIDSKNGYVKWGKKNEFRYYLNYLFRKNPIHAGIIRAKRYFIVAGGLVYEGANQMAYEEFFKNKRKTHKDKNLEQLISDIALDFEKANMAFFKVKFSFVGPKSYRKLYRIPFEKVAFEVATDQKNNSFLTGNICVSDDWLEQKPKFEVIKPYQPNNAEQKECFVMIMEESGQSIDNPKSNSVNPGIYPDPPYGGAITDIDTGIQIGTYHNSEIHNGFSIGSLLYFANGRFKNDDDKRAFERDLGDAATGPTQAGRIFATYGNGQDQKPEVLNLNGNNLPDRYNNTKTGSEQSIIYAHQCVVPSLFGVKQEGSFNASELETGYEIMQMNYFTGRRDDILNALNWIMNDIAGIPGTIKFGEKPLSLPKEQAAPAATMNVNMSSEADYKHKIDVILERLKMRGADRNYFNVLHSMDMSKGLLTKKQIVKDYKKGFAEITDNQLQALNLINQGEDFDSIQKALDLSGPQMNKLFNELQDAKLITKTGALTKAGIQQVAASEINRMTIMYEYALRPDAPKLVEGGHSRPFCEMLLELNRLYTREEIDMISGMEGYDVFAYRGGWYHNPNTDKNEPGCRHEWRQVIVYE